MLPTNPSNNFSGKEFGILIGKIDALHNDVRDLKDSNKDIYGMLTTLNSRTAVVESQVKSHLDGHDERVIKISAVSGSTLGGIIGGIVGGLLIVFEKLKMI